MKKFDEKFRKLNEFDTIRSVDVCDFPTGRVVKITMKPFHVLSYSQMTIIKDFFIMKYGMEFVDVDSYISNYSSGDSYTCFYCFFYE